MENILKEYLERYTKETGWQKFDKSKLEDCIKYIYSEARKKAINNCACIKDEEVLGWAIHYFDEDGNVDIEQAIVPTSKPIVAKDEQVVKVEKKEATRPLKQVKKQKKEEDTNQMSFDL